MGNSNLALYRKYRPQSFEEVVGQEHIVKTLTNSIQGNNISHAYLFSGPRGSGKTTIARLFAKAVNCLAHTAEGEDKKGFEPCNKCSSCLEIMENRSIDLVEIDAASHRGIDDIRELREGIKFAPVKSKYKIFIIDECHQLSKDAANALLKTLEEPPSHAIFLLATTEAHKMISTIVSRCQKFDFKKLQTPEIIKKLEFISKKENVKFEGTALSLIALNARGSFRDAESLLDQCMSFSGSGEVVKTQDIKELLGIVEVGQIAQFVDFLISRNTKDSVSFINTIANDGVDLQEFTKTLVFYLRQALLLKIDSTFLTVKNSGMSTEEVEKLKTQIASLPQKDIQNMLELFITAENKIKYSAVTQLPLELAVIDITYPHA
ncbi:MAG: DNA polymerase III subunit gamma/tau [Candidatus Staskawiczbacteria bacterium]|nr:DNA polymerase III subunit gamma/tau [Candidatus Staskawiczbacteria bacterium]